MQLLHDNRQLGSELKHQANLAGMIYFDLIFVRTSFRRLINCGIQCTWFVQIDCELEDFFFANAAKSS